MKNGLSFFWRCLAAIVVFLAGGRWAVAQVQEPADELPVVVKLGAGSYAACPPKDQAARPDVAGKAGWGDLSQTFTHMKLYVTPDHKGEAIPSAQWWTSLVSTRYSGPLWAYPAMVQAEPDGVAISFPKKWVPAGNKGTMGMTSASRILVRGAGFRPEDAEAQTWSDWLVSFRMAQSDNSFIRVTIGHGLPFTWVESTGVNLRLDVDGAKFFGDDGEAVALPLAASHVGAEIAGDCYGVYAPEGTRFENDGSSLAVRFAGKQHWIAVAVLPKKEHLAFYAPYAPVIPRKTQVDWDYQPKAGRVATTWTIDTEDLSGGGQRDVIQGWIPHQYNPAHSTMDFKMVDGLTYATPRGEMRCAVGHQFVIAWPFTGLLPELPAPQSVTGRANAYRPEVMKSLIRGFTGVTGYGADTYEAGKKILLYGKYMEMAYQLGMKPEAEIFKSRLTEAFTDWFNYEPGKMMHFYAMYPNWGSFMGFRMRGDETPDIDAIQYHRFCYGYHVYAAVLLAMNDPQFGRDYGPMASMLARDNANWDRNDKRFCLFRNFDPWCGYSYSGGTGMEDSIGQETSAESMQSWGAMFLLGEVLGDQPMRDAAAFGYACESRAVAEYLFNRDRQNIPDDIWPHPYSSNIGANGVEWWTWTSSDQYWMHAVQWLPHSPLLKYLYEDPDFARWDYQTMWKDKTVRGWDGDFGDESDMGNLTLSYLQIFDPDEAARIFDDLWKNDRDTAHAPDESGPTYYRLHSGRAMGRIRWDAWCDIPTSTVYRDDKTGRITVAVYNASDQEKDAGYYEAGKLVKTFRVPPRKLIAHHLDAAVAEVAIASPAKTVEPGRSIALAARVTDQYGATAAGAVAWSASGPGRIDANGTFHATGKGTATVIATVDRISGRFDLRVDAAPVLTQITILPAVQTIERGNTIAFSAACTDQYGDALPASIAWTASGGGAIDANGRFAATAVGGPYEIVASAAGVSQTLRLAVGKKSINWAVGKPTVASSEADDDSLAANATDGSLDTLWSSRRADDEWIAADLGASRNVNRVVLRWDTAYASEFAIEFSDDGKTWRTAAEVHQGAGGVNTIPVSGATRWVRMHGIHRGTESGYSLREFEVYGVPDSTAKPQLAEIVIDPPVALIGDLATAQFTAAGYDQFGDKMAVAPAWSVVGKGSIDAAGLYTPKGGGDYAQSRFMIVAQSGEIRAQAYVAVEESRHVSSLEITPTAARGGLLKLPVGGTLHLDAAGVDQFRSRCDAGVKWSVKGPATVDAAGTVIATAPGSITVTAQAGDAHSTLAIQALDPNEVNLALSKKTTTSTGNGAMAVDGNSGTRWESQHGVDPAWIAVDLDATYQINRVVLNWETAAAKVYRVEVSDDGATWKTAATIDDGKAGTREIAMNNARGRYVRIYGTQRTTQYGYSIWELEIYGTPAK